MNYHFCINDAEKTDLLCSQCWIFLCPKCAESHKINKNHDSMKYSKIFHTICHELKKDSESYKSKILEFRNLETELLAKNMDPKIGLFLMQAKLIHTFISTAKGILKKMLNENINKITCLDLQLFCNYFDITKHEHKYWHFVYYFRETTAKLSEISDKIYELCKKCLLEKNANSIIDYIRILYREYQEKYDKLVIEYHSRKSIYSKYLQYLDFMQNNSVSLKEKIVNQINTKNELNGILWYLENTGIYYKEFDGKNKILMNKFKSKINLSAINIGDSIYTIGSSCYESTLSNIYGNELVKYTLNKDRNKFVVNILTPMEYKRCKPGLTCILNRWLYVIGEGEQNFTNTCEKFNLSSESWHFVPSLIKLGKIPYCDSFNNRFIYVMGGIEHMPGKNIEKLDVLDEGSGWQEIMMMPDLSIKNNCFAQIGNNELLILGPIPSQGALGKYLQAFLTNTNNVKMKLEKTEITLITSTMDSSIDYKYYLNKGKLITQLQNTSNMVKLFTYDNSKKHTSYKEINMILL